MTEVAWPKLPMYWPSGALVPLQDQHASARAGQVRGVHERVRAATDHDGVVGFHGSCLESSGLWGRGTGLQETERNEDVVRVPELAVDLELTVLELDPGDVRLIVM